VQQRDEADDEDQPEPEEGVQMTMAAKANGTSKNGSAGGEDEDGPPTPALLREADDSMNGGSPIPGTPLANGSTVAVAGSQITSASSTIPATRYEVFPPVPGQSAPKRRPGRPFGARRRTNSTPQRIRSRNNGIATAPVSRIRLQGGISTPSANGTMTPGTISLRRGRSQLGQSVTNGFNDDDEDEDEDEGGEVRPHRRRPTRSSTGSPRLAKKGKSRVVLEDEEEDEEEEEEEEEEDDEEDGEPEFHADEDQDAEGEEDDMDVDAEGEDDDDIIMPDA
jgi:histone acetyltransferase SAS3